jgi:hypothetical protein
VLDDDVSFKMIVSKEDFISTNLILQAAGNESAKKELHKSPVVKPNQNYYATNILCIKGHYLKDAGQANSNNHHLSEVL